MSGTRRAPHLRWIYNKSAADEFLNATKNEEPNALNTLVKTSVPKTAEAVIGHFVHLPDQDLVHLPQQVVTGGTPLLSGYHNESLRDDVRVMIGKLPGSGPVKNE